MPLTTAEMSHFRARLRERDLELRRAIHDALLHNEDQSIADFAGQVLDSGELSVADTLADTRIIEIQKEVAEQADVMAALARVQSGDYGVCTDCGEDVGVQRLEAYPTAKRCIRCQTHYEKTHRGGQDSTPSL